MIAFPRSLLRRLTGRLGRGMLALLLLAGLWLAWHMWPIRPIQEWSAVDGAGLVKSADGTTVAMTDRTSRPIYVVEVTTGRERCRVPVKSGRRSIALSPDGRWFVLEEASN